MVMLLSCPLLMAEEAINWQHVNSAADSVFRPQPKTTDKQPLVLPPPKTVTPLVLPAPKAKE